MFTLAQFPLPYAIDALTPYISAETIETHHGKHVAGYIDNLNKLIANTPYESVSLTDIIQESAGKMDAQKIFNNAAQVYNHDFFFHGMCPKCTAEIPDEIIEQFGSAENFKKQFKDAATSIFGSGYNLLTAIIVTVSRVNTPDKAVHNNAENHIKHS